MASAPARISGLGFLPTSTRASLTIASTWRAAFGAGTGAVTYEPQGTESLPTAVLQVYDSRRQMVGVGQERFCGSDVAPHCLERQVALLHHVMAFEEANSGRKILSDTQRWKAQFAACREPGTAGAAGADDQRQGRRGLRLAEQLGRQDQQKPVLQAQAQLEPQLGAAERRTVREPADAAGFQVVAGEDPCVSS